MINLVLLGLEKIPEIKNQPESVTIIKCLNRRIQFTGKNGFAKGSSSLSFTYSLPLN